MEKWLLPVLKELATTNRLSDCRFIIEAADGTKQIFDCHKCIFSFASRVFERMFFGDFKESKTNEVVLKNVRSDIFAKFREYLYNYDIKLLEGYDEYTLIDLTKFGDQYLVSSVTEECIRILIDRTKLVDILILIQLYQLGNDMLQEDLIRNVRNNITSRFRDSMNHYAIYELSSDVFFKYMKMVVANLNEAVRFNMIETYLKLNGFDTSKVISKSSDDFDQLDLKTIETNEKNQDLEHHDQGDETELENANKTETKSNVPNENKKESTIQDIQMKNVKNSYIKNLLQLIDYTKMTAVEFYNGPGKSKYFDLQYKYDMMYAIALKPDCEPSDDEN